MAESYTRRAALTRGGQAVLTLSAAGGLLAGCGASSNGGGSTGVRKPTNASGEFTYWFSTSNVDERRYIQRELVPAFERQYPKIAVTASLRPNETLDRVTRTALQAGRGPDLITAGSAASARNYAEANLTRPLDDYARGYGWDKKILPWALDSGRVGGRLHILPADYESLVIFYNKTLFERRGYEVPETRAALEALAAEIQGDGITPFVAGNADWRPATEWYLTVFLNSSAGPRAVYEALQGERPWTDPVFIDAFSLMNDWFQKGWFGGEVQRYFTNRFAPQYASMAKGRIAMDMEGTWAFPQLDDAFRGSGSEYDWFAVPALSDDAPQGTLALAVGGTFSINARSKSPDAVAQYLDWLYSSPRRMGEGLARAGVAPLPVPIDPSDFPRTVDERQVRFYSSLNKATSSGTVGYATWSFWPPRSNVYLYEQFEKVLVGDQSVQDYAAGLDELFQTELRRKQVPPAFEPTA